MNQRVERLRSVMRNKGVGAFLVTGPLNIFYMSGFRSQDSSLFVTSRSCHIITDFRYRQEAEKIDGYELEPVDRGFKETVRRLVSKYGVKRLGVEADNISYASWLSLKRILKGLNAEMLPAGGVIEGLRAIKDEKEMREIKKCAAVAKKVAASLKKIIKRGMAEKAVASEIDRLIREYGGDKAAFDTIVAAGANSSRPHAAPGTRPVAKNDLVLADFGVSLNWYNCDLTRMVILGKIPSLLYDIYNICLEAQRLAIKAIRPGVKVKEVDAAARDHIASKGYGDCFGHSLGHGVGLAVHEYPRISQKSDVMLKPGMIFTIEPGIYIRGKGGVRREDLVLVTEKGCEILTDDISK